MPHNDHYVIIGNGPAGNHAAATLRQKDPDAAITIISDECVPFYYKPRLTGFIADEIDKTRLMVNPLDTYIRKNIRLRLGQEVMGVDPEAREILLDHMEKVHYSKLIIASGSSARVLPAMTPYASHLKFVTSYTDVMTYKNEIRSARSIFIFGGDLVGFKFLKMLNSMGKDVTLMICDEAFWPFRLSDDMLDRIFTSLSRYDVHIIVKDDIADITAHENGYTVRTVKGLDKIADMVFAFNGMIPRIDFVRGSAIDTDRGILVDEYLKTSAEDVYACGSCAQIYNPALKAYTTTIGWPNAAVQGEAAAFNLLGECRVIEYAGRKYFDLEGIRIKTAWWEDIDDEPRP